jgi:hypothetical protein
MATKFVYSDSEVQEIVAKYLQNIDLEVIANQYNKSVASVRMKLVKLGVYVAKTKKAATDKATNSVAPATAKPLSVATKADKLALSKLFNGLYSLSGPALF